MAGYNRVVLVGNLTRDPEYKQLTSGQGVCRLGIATNRQFKNRQTGAMVQEVCFIDIDVWGPQAESCRQYLQKGRSVLIEGRLKLDSWADANGQNRSKHSVVADRVVFLSAADGGAANDQAYEQSNSGESSEPVSELEKGLLDQISQVKKRTAAPKAAVAAPRKAAAPSGAGEVAFKDEPPFEDDLPF
jgi:single-strand DNA-binding protein